MTYESMEDEDRRIDAKITKVLNRRRAEKCTVRDGRFVDPCEDLKKIAEYGNPPAGSTRGIYGWRYLNTSTHKPTRTFFGVKSTSHPKGMAFNFCPWCGERIDAPLLEPAPTASAVVHSAGERAASIKGPPVGPQATVDGRMKRTGSLKEDGQHE